MKGTAVKGGDELEDNSGQLEDTVERTLDLTTVPPEPLLISPTLWPKRRIFIHCSIVNEATSFMILALPIFETEKLPKQQQQPPPPPWEPDTGLPGKPGGSAFSSGKHLDCYCYR